MSKRPKRILAITSGGGHWEQMMLLRDSFSDHETVFANTIPGLAEKSGVMGAYQISDCNRNRPLASLHCVWQVLTIILRERPFLVVTTGAGPGLIGLAIGRAFGARTIWIDSVANSERLSMSGKLAGLFSDLQLTQWQHLSGNKGPRFLGSVL